MSKRIYGVYGVLGVYFVLSTLIYVPMLQPHLVLTGSGIYFFLTIVTVLMTAVISISSIFRKKWPLFLVSIILLILVVGCNSLCEQAAWCSDCCSSIW